jgi:hypothetical protein
MIPTFNQLKAAQLSRQYFRKGNTLERFFLLFMCPCAVSEGLSIAKFCPPVALSRSMAGGRDLAVGNPVESHRSNPLFENRLPPVFDKFSA